MEWIPIVILAVLVGGFFVVRKIKSGRERVTPIEPQPEPDIPPAPKPDIPPEPTPVEPAVEVDSCKPSLVVNGVEAVVGAAYVDVPFGGLPSKLTVAAHDCPHANPEARERAAHRVNHGGASSGFGSGELKVKVQKLGGIPANFGRYGSSRVQIEHGTPAGDPDNGVYRVDELESELATIITKPSRRSGPEDQTDSPITVRMESKVTSRAAQGDDVFPVQIHVNLLPSDGSEAVAVVFREPRP